VPIADDQQHGTLTVLLARLERFWRESQAQRERAVQAQVQAQAQAHRPPLEERRAW